MRAAQLVEIPSTELQLADVPEPELRPLSVIISVEACGICGTDLHIMEGSGYRPEMPFTLGHEPVGTVSAVGPDVDGALVGSRVVPTIFVGCNHCEPCRSGDERLCVNGPTITGVFRQPGGFAERMALMATQLVPVPAQVPLEVAATLVDAGATAHNAVRTALDGPTALGEFLPGRCGGREQAACETTLWSWRWGLGPTPRIIENLLQHATQLSKASSSIFSNVPSFWSSADSAIIARL